jgi:DNA-binding MltR family transcriptional regulator
LQSEKYWSQEFASNKLEKGPLRDYETGFCLHLALTVLEKKIFKDLAMFFGFWPKCDLEMKVNVEYYD